VHLKFQRYPVNECRLTVDCYWCTWHWQISISVLYFVEISLRKVLLYCSPNVNYFENQETVFIPTAFCYVADVNFWTSNLGFLFDMEDQNNLTTIPYRKCNFVLSISPNLDLINDFKKHVKNESFYMPIWK